MAPHAHDIASTPTPMAGTPPFACPLCPYHATARCEGASTLGSEPRAPAGCIGCHDARLQVRFYENLHRRDGEPEAASTRPIPPLPAFIPVLARVPKSLRPTTTGLCAVGYTSLLFDGGSLRPRSAAGLRAELGLAADAKLCLIGTASDARLEKAWARSEEQRLWARLARLRFEFATSTTFSVWDEQPRFDQIYNQERNAWSYARFTRLGLPTAPFLFAPTRGDLHAAVRWLERHREVDLVATLAQFYRRPDDFERLLMGLHALRDAARRKLRFLVVGCATAAKIERLFAEFPEATVASTKPVMQALHGRATTPGLTHEKAGRELPRGELLRRNIERFREFCGWSRPIAALPA